MSERNSPNKAASLMYMIIAIMVIWAAIYSINHITKIYSISNGTYHVSMVLLGVFLLIFFLYMVYQGLIAESLIALMTMISIGSYSVVYVIEGYTPLFVLDPIVLITGVIPIVVIGLDRKRIPLAIGCLLMLLGCCINTDTADDVVLILRAMLLLLSGAIFAVCSGYKMYTTLRNIDGPTNSGRALNASAMCETVGYVALGMAILYSIIVTNEYLIKDTDIPMIVMMISIVVALIIAVYSAVNGSISSGTTIITTSVFIFLVCITNNRVQLALSPMACFVFALPLVFTAYRFHRKGDTLLTVFAVMTIVCIAFRSIQQYNDSFEYSIVTSVLFIIDALIIEYVALSRTLYVEKGRKILPLLDGNSFVNEEEPWNRRFLPRPKDKDNSIALQTYLLMGINLILIGAYFLNYYYWTFPINLRLFHMALFIFSLLMVISSMENIVRGRLTETIGAIFVGIFLLSYALSGLMGLEHLTDLDILPAMCVLVCGIVFVMHRDYFLSAAFLCASAAMLLILIVNSEMTLVIGGILLIVAGAIIMIRYNYVKLIRKQTNPTITDRGAALDNVTLSRLARTLGVFIVGLVLLMVAFEGKEDIKCIMMVTLLTGITTIVSVYGLMKDDAPGFMLLFGTSLLLFVMSICFITTENMSFDLLIAVFAWANVPIILVYLKRKKYLSAAIGTLLFLALILTATTSFNTLCSILFFIVGILMCSLALYNWLVHEGLLEPFIDPKVFGYSIKGN